MMVVWRSEVVGMDPGYSPVAGDCRSIYNFKPSVSVRALFYKSSALKHKAGVQLTSGSSAGLFSQFQKNKNSRTSKQSLRPFQDSATSEVDIKSLYSFHTNKSTKNALCMVKNLYLLQVHNMHSKFANLRPLLIGTTTIYIL